MNADEEILAGYADPDAGYPDADTQTKCNNYQTSIFVHFVFSHMKGMQWFKINLSSFPEEIFIRDMFSSF